METQDRGYLKAGGRPPETDEAAERGETGGAGRRREQGGGGRGGPHGRGPVEPWREGGERNLQSGELLSRSRSLSCLSERWSQTFFLFGPSGKQFHKYISFGKISKNRIRAWCRGP